MMTCHLQSNLTNHGRFHPLENFICTMTDQRAMVDVVVEVKTDREVEVVTTDHPRMMNPEKTVQGDDHQINKADNARYGKKKPRKIHNGNMTNTTKSTETLAGEAAEEEADLKIVGEARDIANAEVNVADTAKSVLCTGKRSKMTSKAIAHPGKQPSNTDQKAPTTIIQNMNSTMDHVDMENTNNAAINTKRITTPNCSGQMLKMETVTI
mmetsp:Transcript_28841/g.32035  ORF Transcript_28841/g.32035 Transcript_28841/m.32035 type:complete len:210 (+) Transcript_28841:303-932(+)